PSATLSRPAPPRRGGEPHCATRRVLSSMRRKKTPRPRPCRVPPLLDEEGSLDACTPPAGSCAPERAINPGLPSSHEEGWREAPGWSVPRQRLRRAKRADYTGTTRRTPPF